jgi:hypothetical protein
LKTEVELQAVQFLLVKSKRLFGLGQSIQEFPLKYGVSVGQIISRALLFGRV